MHHVHVRLEEKQELLLSIFYIVNILILLPKPILSVSMHRPFTITQFTFQLTFFFQLYYCIGIISFDTEKSVQRFFFSIHFDELSYYTSCLSLTCRIGVLLSISCRIWIILEDFICPTSAYPEMRRSNVRR